MPQRLGGIKHAVVVERAATAHMRARNDDSVAGVAQHLDRRVQRTRVEVVVERVGPQQHGWPVVIDLLERFAERPPREPRYWPLAGDPTQPRDDLSQPG